jgi:hypothetical protein
VWQIILPLTTIPEKAGNAVELLGNPEKRLDA